MRTLRIELQGADTLKRALKQLPGNVQAKVLTQALRAGAKPIAKEAKRIAPKKTHDLANSIKVRVGKTREPGEKKVLVVTGQKLFGGEFFYGYFVHQGHKVGKRSAAVRTLQGDVVKAGRSGDSFAKRRARLALAAGDSRQRVRARRFMKQAFDNKKGEAQRAITDTLAAGIEREWEKLVR